MNNIIVVLNALNEAADASASEVQIGKQRLLMMSHKPLEMPRVSGARAYEVQIGNHRLVMMSHKLFEMPHISAKASSQKRLCYGDCMTQKTVWQLKEKGTVTEITEYQTKYPLQK